MYHVYLAGPIAGTRFHECVDWRKDFIRSMPPAIKCLSPMRGKEECFRNDELITPDQYDDTILARDAGIMARDFFDCQRADVIVVHLLRAKKASIGTMMELAWAYQNHTPTIVVCDPGDLHDHPMVRMATKFRVASLAEAQHITRIILDVDYTTNMTPKVDE
jgi:hypothetical protein